MKLHRFALCLSLLAAAAPSHAVGRLVDVSILDRDTGAVLPVHHHRGEYWVAGIPGSRYAVVLRNRMGERVLAVTAVDGVNVLSGETAGWQQTGYVLSPSQYYQVTGWRKSAREVAAFAFSSVGGSYAALTGRGDHVGVIGVAVFRERRPEPVSRWSPSPMRPEPDSRSRLNREQGPGPDTSHAPSTFGAGPGGAAADRLPERATAEADAAGESFASRGKAPAPRLGTSHGEREASWVAHTTFERERERPDDIIRIRYDSRENLIASGVIRRPMPQRIDPFPASEQARYVPDPPPIRH